MENGVRRAAIARGPDCFRPFSIFHFQWALLTSTSTRRATGAGRGKPRRMDRFSRVNPGESESELSHSKYRAHDTTIWDMG